MAEVEQIFRERVAIGQWLVRVGAQVLEEWMSESVERLQSGLGIVPQEFAYEVDCLLERLGVAAVLLEDGLPLTLLDLRELELHVVLVHRVDLLPRRRAKDFDDLH